MLNLGGSTRMIKDGDVCSKTAYSWAQKTFAFRKGGQGAIEEDSKASYAQITHYGSVRLAMASDGVGTKVELAERTGIYDTLAYDLVAMLADDLVCNGAIPTNLSNILDVNRLDEKIVDDLMRGLYNAARMAALSVTGGEIAELGERISGYGDGMHFNWCATAMGYLPEGRSVITGEDLEPGDAIIALASRGFRSNGYTLIREVMKEEFGVNWHLKEYSYGKKWGELLLTPSLIYSPVLTKCLDSIDSIRALAHITGGGIPGNLRRMLQAKRLGADLFDLFEPLPFMKHIQKMAGLDDRTAYSLWNMGNGMLIAVKESDKEEVLHMITENHYQAKIVGVITDDEDLLISSKGCGISRLKFKA